MSIYKHKCISGHGSHNITMRVTNTDSNVLKMLRNWTGIGRLAKRSPRKDFPYHKQQWEWTLNPNDIRQLFPLIIPCLQIKRKPAELIMEFLGYKARVRGRHVTEAEIARCDKIVAEIRGLNKRAMPGVVVV